jgi:peroxiredoxin (alkyl hydroperoxide reductase subunit C)
MGPLVGSIAPVFSVRALVGDVIKDARLSDYLGRWVVLYFYGKDDTALCESENIGFRAHYPDFQRLGVELLAASVDSLESHKKWRDEGLGTLPYPWIADDQKVLARAYGVLNEDTGIAMRGTFVINPDGVLKHASVNDHSTGRNVSETLRIVQALQTGKPTRCNWLPGEPTL